MSSELKPRPKTSQRALASPTEKLYTLSQRPGYLLAGRFCFANIDAPKGYEAIMNKRQRFYPLAFIGLICLACSLTASPAAVLSASQPTAQPTPSPTRPPTPTPSQAVPTPAGVACVVNVQALNVRTCAGVACPVSGWLLIGQAVNVASITTGWAALTAGGYVNSNYLTCEGQ